MTVDSKRLHGAGLSYGVVANSSIMTSQQDLVNKLLSLDLSETASTTPDSNSCLAHVRLLCAFEKLKHSIGFKDGLWEIWDNRAASADNSLEVLVKLREKRWAIYIARAVVRYEAWWDSFPQDMLLEKDMMRGASCAPEKFTGFVDAKPVPWKLEVLPPIGQLCTAIIDYLALTSSRCIADLACTYAESKNLS